MLVAPMARGRQLGAAVGRMTPTSRSEVHNESVYRGRPTLAPLCSKYETRRRSAGRHVDRVVPI